MLSDSNIDGISSIIKSYLAQFPSQSLPLLPKKKTNKKTNKKSTRKKFLVFSEMDLSSPNIKKILIFSQKKAFLIFSYISENSTLYFSAQVCKIKKIHPMKISCTSGKGNSKNNYYISGNGSPEAETIILISGSNLQSAINK